MVVLLVVVLVLRVLVGDSLGGGGSGAAPIVVGQLLHSRLVDDTGLDMRGWYVWCMHVY